MRPIARSLVVGSVLLQLLAPDALSSPLRSGDPYYLQATQVTGSGGPPESVDAARTQSLAAVAKGAACVTFVGTRYGLEAAKP